MKTRDMKTKQKVIPLDIYTKGHTSFFCVTSHSQCRNDSFNFPTELLDKRSSAF